MVRSVFQPGVSVNSVASAISCCVATRQRSASSSCLYGLVWKLDKEGRYWKELKDYLAQDASAMYVADEMEVGDCVDAGLFLASFGEA